MSSPDTSTSLVLLKDGLPYLGHRLVGTTEIGRGRECGIQILDLQLSRQHARLAWEEEAGGRWTLEDLGSRNGTFVAEKRIQEPTPLSAGVALAFGTVEALFDPPLDLLHSAWGEGTLCMLDGDTTTQGRLEELRLEPIPPTDQGALLASHDLNCDLLAHLEPETLLTTLLDRLMTRFQAERGFILLSEQQPTSGARPRLRTAAIRGSGPVMPISRQLVERTLRDNRPLLLSDALDVSSFVASKSVVAHQLRSVMLVPLPRPQPLPQPRSQHASPSPEETAPEPPLGLIQLDNAAPGAFTTERLAELAWLARMASPVVHHALALDRERRRQGVIDPDPQEPEALTPFIGEAKSVERLLHTTARAALSDATVLITGESGSGKELLARRLHEQSPRARGPWVAINCGGLPQSLLESELFGHERGAFTGANRRKRGCFELADGGTLFLDEIAEMGPAAQVRLLRALQESSFYRVGGETPVQVDVRVVAATNRSLPEQLESGALREDLYYRLNVIHLETVPLRDRAEDVPLLFAHFCEQLAGRMGKPIPVAEPEALALLGGYRWPGNVRELRNVVERMVVLAESSSLSATDVPAEIAVATTAAHGDAPLGKLKAVVQQTERALILRALSEARGKKAEACRILGISRPTLDRKLAQYDLTV